LKNWTCDDRYDKDDDHHHHDDYNGDGGDDDDDDDDDDDYDEDDHDDNLDYDDDNSKSQGNVYTWSSILLTNTNNSHTQNTKCLLSSKRK
jgi:hypothetical protein